MCVIIGSLGAIAMPCLNEKNIGPKLTDYQKIVAQNSMPLTVLLNCG